MAPRRLLGLVTAVGAGCGAVLASDLFKREEPGKAPARITVTEVEIDGDSAAVFRLRTKYTITTRLRLDIVSASSAPLAARASLEGVDSLRVVPHPVTGRPNHYVLELSRRPLPAGTRPSASASPPPDSTGGAFYWANTVSLRLLFPGIAGARPGVASWCALRLDGGEDCKGSLRIRDGVTVALTVLTLLGLVAAARPEGKGATPESVKQGVQPPPRAVVPPHEVVTWRIVLASLIDEVITEPTFGVDDSVRMAVRVLLRWRFLDERPHSTISPQEAAGGDMRVAFQAQLAFGKCAERLWERFAEVTHQMYSALDDAPDVE
jgi:hypothetical protein